MGCIVFLAIAVSSSSIACMGPNLYPELEGYCFTSAQNYSVAYSCSPSLWPVFLKSKDFGSSFTQ